MGKRKKKCDYKLKGVRLLLKKNGGGGKGKDGEGDQKKEVSRKGAVVALDCICLSKGGRKPKGPRKKLN